jgi:hypothetical protein
MKGQSEGATIEKDRKTGFEVQVIVLTSIYITYFTELANLER